MTQCDARSSSYRSDVFSHVLFTEVQMNLRNYKLSITAYIALDSMF